MNRWRRFLQGTLELDDRACQAYLTVLNTGPEGRGYMEACRILAHLLKDKMKEQDPGKPQDPRNWSRWFQRTSEEAIEAMAVPDEVRNLRRYQTGKGAWGSYQVPAPGKGGASSSSSSHQGPGAPHGGKGCFGKVFQKGFR